MSEAAALQKVAQEIRLIRQIMWANLLENYGYSVQGTVKALVKSGEYTKKESTK